MEKVPFYSRNGLEFTKSSSILFYISFQLIICIKLNTLVPLTSMGLLVLKVQQSSEHCPKSSASATSMNSGYEGNCCWNVWSSAPPEVWRHVNITVAKPTTLQSIRFPV